MYLGNQYPVQPRKDGNNSHCKTGIRTQRVTYALPLINLVAS